MTYELYIWLGYGAFFGILGGFLLISFGALKKMKKESQRTYKK